MSEGAWPWNLPLETVSASSLSNFQRCPEQFRRKYIKKQWDTDSSVSALLGNAIHGSAETNFRQKAMSGTDLSLSDVDEAYATSFEENLDRSGGASAVNWSMRVGQARVKLTHGEAKDRGRPLARHYRETVSPGIQPVGCEEWFRIKVEGVPVDVRGKIDVITDAKKKADLKFSASLKTRPEPSWRLQALTYMLVEETTNKDGSVRISSLGDHDFEWHTGTFGGVKNIPRIVTPNEEPLLAMTVDDNAREIARRLIKSTVDSISMFWERFGPDQPWPGALQHSWACNYCHIHPSRGGDCFWWVGKTDDVIPLF